MKNITCGVVRDLMESYKEGLTTENVSAAMKEHIASCEGCRQICEQWELQKQQIAQMEQIDEQQLQNKIISHRSYILGFLAGAAIVMSIFLLWSLGSWLYDVIYYANL